MFLNRVFGKCQVEFIQEKDMRFQTPFCLILIFVFSIDARALPPEPTAGEITTATNWVQNHFGPDMVSMPFSFQYGGQSSRDFLSSWQTERTTESLNGSRTQQTIKYTDTSAGLEVRCEVIEYADYPTVEWIVYFKNIRAPSSTTILSIDDTLQLGTSLDLQGSETPSTLFSIEGAVKVGTSNENMVDTLILEQIKALDLSLVRAGAAEFMLHQYRGSYGLYDEFAPLDNELVPEEEVTLSGHLGRPSERDWPYFNLEGAETGLIIAVGCPGQWEATLTRDAGTGLSIRAGQELTHFRLHPGEEARTPLIVLQFWDQNADNIRAQNIWRRWMLDHNLPRPGGNLPLPQLAGSSAAIYGEMANATEENQKMFIDRYLAENINIDYWWMDAYWYQRSPVDGSMPDSFWLPDPPRFPNGIRSVTDYAHARNIKSILWFEPENYLAGSWLKNNYPEYMLSTDLWADHDLLDWGNPQALQFIIDFMSNAITEHGIDTYRLDFNWNPMNHWVFNEAEDRRGITENHYVTGFLAFYDDLLARHPNLLIDNCSSGGRRNDLETMRRSVPLWRSDYTFGWLATQCQTYGLASWLPYFGTGTIEISTYAFRSNMMPAMVSMWDMRELGLDYNLLRQLTSQWRQIAHYYFGDYYPLTSYSTENDVWMAWQFDRYDLNEGMVQAFRREASGVSSMVLALRGLEETAQYELTNFDVPGTTTMTGQNLMSNGLPVSIPTPSGAVVITYRKL